MVKIIGLTGKAGSGKSTVAHILVNDYGFIRVKMAGPLKSMLRAIGLTDAHIEGELKEVPCPMLCGQTPRYAMQTLGTEWGRDIIGNDFWTNAWRESVWAACEYAEPAGIVCDDVRFANEVAAVLGMGGKIWHLNRGFTVSADTHSSEIQPLRCDLYIENMRGVDDLRDIVARELVAQK